MASLLQRACRLNHGGSGFHPLLRATTNTAAARFFPPATFPLGKDTPKNHSCALSTTAPAADRPPPPSVQDPFEGDHDAWAAAFKAATANVQSEVSFRASSEQLRALTQTDLVKATDLRDAPERFFHAHRLLARHCVEHGPGFWIRFTVHYNLFAGTILAVGDDDQVDALAAYQAKGLLGCFGLTEALAGVQSGLVVETTATWDNDRRTFVLHTPHPGARKNWISQGFVADKALVLADMRVAGQSVGPHAFVVDFREEAAAAAAAATDAFEGGQDGRGDGGGGFPRPLVSPGITVDDMGPKTVGNDLDNAWIAFDHVEVPHSALLRRHCDVLPSASGGEYCLKTAGVRPFEMIGQRLYTGRVAVAQAALEYRRELFRRTKAYSDAKPTFHHAVAAEAAEEKGEGAAPPVLSDIPQLRALYEENELAHASLAAFTSACERALSDVLRQGGVPPPPLVDAIATAKVRCVEESIAYCFRLKQEVGSFALMRDSGFRHLDFLQCCKFAEGDSRILMQKLARDRLKRFGKAGGTGASSGGGGGTGGRTGEVAALAAREEELCGALAARLAAAGKDKAAQAAAWSAEWRAVYELAEAVMARVQAQGL